MRTKFLLAVLVFCLFSGVALAAGKKSARKAPSGLSDASVSAAVDEFVTSLNSLEDAKVLAAIAAADRGALKGRENLIGLVYPKKLTNPKVTSWEKVESGGRTIGVLAKVTVEEQDPLDPVTAPVDRTWFLALDGKELKVSVSSVWLDAGLVQEN